MLIISHLLTLVEIIFELNSSHKPLCTEKITSYTAYTLEDFSECAKQLESFTYIAQNLNVKILVFVLVGHPYLVNITVINGA